jgi:poly-beta-1,6-N-acetyl-D-glucosamine biosynthesis protein PgaD
MNQVTSDVCIHAPELLTRREQVRDRFATGIMWVLYAYLWLPVISLAAWVLGFEFAYDVLVRAGGFAHLKTLLYWYGLTIAIIFVAFGAWSFSNRMRFAGNDRRRHLTPVTNESLAAFFEISEDDLAMLRRGRSLSVGFNAVGAISEIQETD